MRIILNGSFISYSNKDYNQLRKEWLYEARVNYKYLEFSSLKYMADILLKNTKNLTKSDFFIVDIEELDISREEKDILIRNASFFNPDIKEPITLEYVQKPSYQDLFLKGKNEIKNEILKLVSENNQEQVDLLLEKLSGFISENSGAYS